MKVAVIFLCVLFGMFFFSCVPKQSIVSDGKVTVINYGADPKGIQDCSEAFKKALNQNNTVFVTKGKYRIDQTLRIANQNLILENGVEIIRVKKANNNGPIFWMGGSYAKIEGTNRNVKIKSERPSPNGVIKIGHRDYKDVTRTVTYCELRNLTIEGIRSSDRTNNVGVLLFNSQERGDVHTASYFHTLDNLIIQFFDTGLHLKGMSNGNSISSIIFNRVGNKTTEQAILLEGAMENNIYDFFHHFSENSTTVRMINFNMPGGSKLSPVYNYITHGIAEQNGKDARCLDIEDGLHNIININCNAPKGMKTFKDFEKKKNVLLKK